MKKRVAVIGAGPSGLAQLQAFHSASLAGEDVPEVVCFEKQSAWGGLWNYTWRTGTDEYGDPVHGSMYRFLWSNGPKECLEFADYTFDEHFGKPIPSFPPLAVLADYILGRAKKMGLQKYVRFDTAVQRISFDKATESFRITVKDRKSDTQSTEEFDSVVVATGHFSTPNVPQFEGVEKFAGRVMHAHDFRDAREFAGRRVLIIGSSYSAEDIALQCHKYGATSVIMAYRTKPMGFKWPASLEERPLLQRLEDKIAYFKDGTSAEVDALILCTGYLHNLPFLDDELRLVTHNRLYPPNLYKGVVWQDNPKLMYVGMQDQFYTFSMFDLQAWYVRDIMMGKIQLPPGEKRLAHNTEWVQREEAAKDQTAQIDFQTEYLNELAAEVDYPKFDTALCAKHFKDWEHEKDVSILGYRDGSYASPCTGTVAPKHHTPWLEALDDSLATFLNTR